MARTKNESERLEPEFMEKVIAGLAQDKPITKKLACEILNITYNTTRLAKLIEDYQRKKEIDAKRRAEKRGKPATPEEIIYIIQEYLLGATIDSISKYSYRGATFIKTVLDDHDVPIRIPGHSYRNPQLIPDGAVRLRFNVGEKVYSARYDSLARIEAEFKPGQYRIWVEADQQYAYQPPEELASLEHLIKLGVKL